MATLVGVVVRHERRVRLRFDVELRATAFATSFYVVTNRDGRAVSPAVVGVLVVGADLHEAELALGSDLAPGALYEVSVDAAPAADGSPIAASGPFRPGESTVVDPAVGVDDLDALLYGVDLVHDGADYVETADGDLASVSGLPNVEAAVRRRLFSDGLPWDPSYGAKARRFVDGPVGALPPLRGSLVKEALKDDRVASADPTLAPDGMFDVEVTPIGASGPATLRIPIPTS
jgi:hypothetical protein